MGRRAVKIKNPKVILTEWIPFGKNYMTEFIDRITLKEYQRKRIKYFTASEKKDIKDRAIFETSEYQTTVNIIDFIPETSVKFTAEMRGDGKKDVFIYVDYLGRCIYASEIIKAGDEEDVISLDNLSFIIPDLILDSSRIMSHLIASPQRYLLETLYGEIKVYKHVTVLTETEVVINEDTLVEISQVIGAVKNIIEIDNGLIIFGDFGIFISNPNPEKFEKFIYYYPFIRSITGVSRDLFFKLNTIASKLEVISSTLESGVDLEDITEIRGELSRIDRELAVIEIVCGYLKEIIEFLNNAYPPNFGDFDLMILEKVEAERKLKRLNYRIAEIENILASNSSLATSLARLLTTISEDLERKIANQLAENTKYQVAIGEAMEVLEIGIFGVYALEAAHVLLLTSGKEEILQHTKIFGFPLEFWIILAVTILGVYIGKIVIEYRKKKILEE
ncbi:hypothetical protein JH146_0106 [Methanocaldococcus bathoardescens]|uniref:Uncharacterized protein n=1 Tax=Methanocaldococcus bathoardescens TaxID=1301915 RepID=A0A076LDT4_9EURY|nr:hypothetical protein [Methanocaldococcus bathoardescens]AIJ04957.1 hypothetical protein JH146_0106 [Methanocaldococcus bathoardescens]